MNKSLTKTIFYFIILSSFFPSFAQRAIISIEECYELTNSNYPLIKQFELIELSKEFNLSNANKGYLPQVSFFGKATYQSDVTELPINLPGMNIKKMNKDQYQVGVEIPQTLWDGDIISSQMEITKVSSEIERQKIEKEMFALRERINQIYFGILLLNEQLKQNDLLQSELLANFEKVTSYMQNGVANQTDLAIIKVEILNVQQRKSELLAMKNSYLQMLSAFTELKIDNDTEFVVPKLGNTELSSLINLRPELKLFDAQNVFFKNQSNTIYAAVKPRIGLFLQGGYGNPGLNMLKNAFSTYYIGGVRFSWNLGEFYSISNKLELIEINHKTIESQRETFLFNNRLQILQQESEIEKLTQLLKNDDEIISLRNKIKKSAEAKVENGIMTVTDLLREINAENFAVTQKSLHEIQLLMSIYNIKYLYNN
ncbi:MAG: TolC family protein [Ignavibacteria bacterium]|nr:TolC family protein [Ignavibacteria bacterium]